MSPVKRTATILICLLSLQVILAVSHKPGNTLTIDEYFEKIRNDEAAATAFFAAMPKGGDLHNHFTGSIYAEFYLQEAIDNKLFIDPKTLKLWKPSKTNTSPTRAYKRIDTLVTSRSFDFPDLKQRLFQDWSIKDYFDELAPSDKHFFDAFAKFPNLDWQQTKRGLLELKERAKKEHVQYLEIMLASIPYPKLDDLSYQKLAVKYDEPLRQATNASDTNSLNALFTALYNDFDQSTDGSARAITDSIEKIHHDIDDNDFTMRYLCFAKREARPTEAFQGILGAFKAAQRDSLIVGVNFVAPEDGRLSMKDYALHMQMFRFLHAKYPAVNISLHAGELALGLVRPEDLTWHINEAVYVGAAKRIGHGVDLPYERNSDSLLSYMSHHKIAVEINLISNQFILKVRDDLHPILLYAGHQVPIVISTDDAGILRTNLTAQFVALAKRYSSLHYTDIKQFILNSIEYSFIKDTALKQGMLTDLKNKLAAFESTILHASGN